MCVCVSWRVCVCVCVCACVCLCGCLATHVHACVMLASPLDSLPPANTGGFTIAVLTALEAPLDGGNLAGCSRAGEERLDHRIPGAVLSGCWRGENLLFQRTLACLLAVIQQRAMHKRAAARAKSPTLAEGVVHPPLMLTFHSHHSQATATPSKRADHSLTRSGHQSAGSQPFTAASVVHWYC